MSYRIIQGDALTVLRTLPYESVNCCVTSPPYWGLRDYGMPGQIGLEDTPERYVNHLVGVFSEVRRALRKDGTLWLNLGDSYNGSKGGRSWELNAISGHTDNLGTIGRYCKKESPGLKPKDLIGIPWRVAFALQADGWWLRSDIIWCKGNCMPESVQDRPTRAHEYIFLLSKSAKYYYNAEAIKEPVAESTPARYHRNRSETHKWADGGPGNQTIARTMEHMRKQDGHGRRHSGFNEREFKGDPRLLRNKRSWWVINTYPVKDAHFATYPPDLIEPCILAGCPEDGTVLDPFAGSGTTGLAAIRHGKKFMGIELNPEYIQIAEKRLREKFSLFAQDGGAA